MRDTLREQLPLAQLPEAWTLEVPRGPLAEPERVQALASATAATDREPMMAEAMKNFFMVEVSSMKAAVAVAMSGRLGLGCQRSLAGRKPLLLFCQSGVTMCNNCCADLVQRLASFRMQR